MKKKKKTNPNYRAKRWTPAEEDQLINAVRLHPNNLAKCFISVASDINRTPSAVAGHWYTKASKRKDVLCFFTASSSHLSRNRKNGAGESIKESMWKRFLKIIGFK